MKIISLFLVIVFCTLSSATFASVTPKTSSAVTYTEAPALSLDANGGGGDAGGIEGFITWILETLLSFVIGLFSPCQEVPDFTSFKSGTKSLDLTSGQWVSTGAWVTSGKAMKINWTTQGATARVRKYAVMYRIDPRFSRPQIFILKYKYPTSVAAETYESDFHTYSGGQIAANQSVVSVGQAFADRLKNNNNYFNFVNRSKINISAGDVVNISLVGMNDFINKSPAFKGDLAAAGNNVASIYTSTGGLPDNKIIYLDAITWCKGGSAGDPNPPYICSNSGAPGNTETYTYNNANLKTRIMGILDVNSTRFLSTPPCPEGAKGKNFQTPNYTEGQNDYTYKPCLYDRGRTMPISIGGNIVKNVYTPFTHSNASGIDFFYYKGGAGVLDFVDPQNTIPANEMFPNQLSSNWAWTNSADVISNINTTTKVLYAGRYIMDIVIGNGSVGAFDQQNAIGVQYKIMPNDVKGQPQIAAGNGIDASQTYTANANTTGILWLKANNPNSEVMGNINVAYTHYQGDTFLSDILYDGVVQPVQKVIFNTSKLFYSALATNPTLQWAIRLLLTFYIIHSSLRFLAGMKEVTMNSLLEDVIRITVVIAVLTPTSWDFFYNNVFRIFLEGMNYLFSNVVGLTSNVNNPFGFVDVIFRKYTDARLWTLLLAEVISITNGLTVLGIAVIIAILSFVSIVLEVVVSYVFAYVVIAVLISLAPLFIICMLFEHTRGIFDNWLSLMFNYMIQPTVLLVFFLLLDQLMTNQLNQVLTKACWGYLISFSLTIPMDWAGMGNWSIPLGLGIPGLIPQASGAVVPGAGTQSAGTLVGIFLSSFMFCIYCKISSGMNDYVTSIVGAITSVQGGGGGSHTKAIASEVSSARGKVASVATAPVRAVGRELKEKLWDGKVATEEPKLRGKAGEEQAYVAEKAAEEAAEAEAKKAKPTADKPKDKPSETE